MANVIGIDLGTTNSVVTVFEGGEPVVVANAEGSRTTPSVVGFTKNGERLVGALAKNQAVSNPERTISSIKRHMGEAGYSVEIDGKKYSPEEISAMILAKLKNDAEKYLGEEVKEAVITVPAYFNDAQRQAIMYASSIAGIEYVRVMLEPTAAAIAYDIAKDIKSEELILVFDLGGGTCDVSVLEVDEDGAEYSYYLGHRWDIDLGGDDFDKRIFDWVVAECKAEYGIDLVADSIIKQCVIEASEKAKIDLSSKRETNINIEFVTSDTNCSKQVDLTLTRAKFEEMTADLVDSMIVLTQKAIEEAEVTVKDIHKILMVGGASRIPAVQEALRKYLGKEPLVSLNPEQCLSIGACIHGESICLENMVEI